MHAFIIYLLALRRRCLAITYAPRKVVWRALWHIIPLAICRLEYLMAMRNVVLPDLLERDINELVETGRYQDRSEVIRTGLCLLLQ